MSAKRRLPAYVCAPALSSFNHHLSLWLGSTSPAVIPSLTNWGSGDLNPVGRGHRRRRCSGEGRRETQRDFRNELVMSPNRREDSKQVKLISLECLSAWRSTAMRPPAVSNLLTDWWYQVMQVNLIRGLNKKYTLAGISYLPNLWPKVHVEPFPHRKWKIPPSIFCGIAILVHHNPHK